MCLAATAFVPSTFLYGSLCSHSVDHWTRSLFSTRLAFRRCRHAGRRRDRSWSDDRCVGGDVVNVLGAKRLLMAAGAGLATPRGIDTPARSETDDQAELLYVNIAGLSEPIPAPPKSTRFVLPRAPITPGSVSTGRATSERSGSNRRVASSQCSWPSATTVNSWCGARCSNQ